MTFFKFFTNILFGRVQRVKLYNSSAEKLPENFKSFKLELWNLQDKKCPKIQKFTTFLYLENPWILSQMTFYFNQNNKEDYIAALPAGYFWGYALKSVERRLKNPPFFSFFPLLAPIALNLYTVVVSKLHLTLSVWRSLALV